jgi:small-conductance mechanosensitive channel
MQFNAQLMSFILRIQANNIAEPPNIVAAIQLLLLGILAYIVVRVLNFLVFGMFRLRRGFDAPTLVQNVFSIVAFSLLFLLIFSWEFPKANLGACSQHRNLRCNPGSCSTGHPRNFFAGISLQADRPFQVGDVITVGATASHRSSEEISWRAIKIRTFQNHVVLINNSSARRNP